MRGGVGGEKGPGNWREWSGLEWIGMDGVDGKEGRRQDWREDGGG